MNGRSISFVLPAFNEAGNIVRAVGSVLDAAEGCCSEFEVIVVDDGSFDETAALVEALGSSHPEIRLVRHARRRGYGDAVCSGFAAATCEYLFLTDADNQFDMSELPLLLAHADRADIVVGYRQRRNDSAVRRLNAWAWNQLARALFCVPVRDVDCAFKLFHRQALAALDIRSHGAMVSTEVVVKLARRGATFVEVGVSHLPRTAGASTGARPAVILRALAELVRLYPVLRGLDTVHAPAISRPVLLEGFVDIAAIEGAAAALPPIGVEL